MSLALLGAVLASWIVVGGAFAQGSGLQPLRDAVRAAEDHHDALVVSFDEEMARYDALTARIETFRVQMGAFDVYELRSALRDAQSAADALAALDAAVREARADLREAEDALAVALRAEVSRLEAALRARPMDVANIVAELNRVSDELGALSAPLPEYAPVPIEDIIRGVSDTPDEIYDAVAELADVEARLERQLEELRVRLRDAEASARVLDAAGAFAAEESLLDDDGGRRVGPRDATRPATDTTGGAAGPEGGDPGPAAPIGGDSEGPVRNDDGPTSGDPPSDGGAFPGTDGAESEGGGFGGAGPDDGDLGSDPDTNGGLPPDFGSVGELGPPSAVPLTGRTGTDPTVLDASTGTRRRARSELEALREHEERLARELETIRAERERLAARARALESLD